MMDIQWGAIAASLVLLALALELTRRRWFVEEYALAWIAAAGGLLALSLSRGWLDWLAAQVGVYYPPSLLLLASIFVGTVLAMYFTGVISRQRRHLERLAREYALLEERVRALEPRPAAAAEKEQQP